MTGTVLDGEIDVALLETDGEAIAAFGPAEAVRYDKAVTALIARAMEDAKRWAFAGPEPDSFAVAESALTLAQSDAVATVLQRHGLALQSVAAVGFHGQTVLHRRAEPSQPGATRQLGDGQAMADRLGIPVVFDFRSADVAAGGQGAPLAPIYHRALLQRVAREDATFLNLGGVGNLTALDGDELVAFDTGPANAPINDFLRAHTGRAMDENGATAARGTVDEARIRAALRHPYFRAPPPKSLDRDDFTRALADGLSLADGAATLTAFAAECVAAGLTLLPRRPSALIVSGGGRHNATLTRALVERAKVAVVPADAVGLDGDAVEAQCFAYLAARRLAERPISFPGTTGVPAPMTGGRIAHPRQATF